MVFDIWIEPTSCHHPSSTPSSFSVHEEAPIEMQPATQNGPWSDLIRRSFFIAGSQSETSEKPFYGPWTRLLSTVFPPDTMFQVDPQCPGATTRESADFVVVLVIYVNTTPVLVVEVKPSGDLRYASKRDGADGQLRRRLLDYAPDLKIPELYGVSAFGTRMAFYKYTHDGGIVGPGSRAGSPDPDELMDTSPREWWAYDVMEEEGANKFKEMVEEVKEMCGGVMRLTP